MIDDENARPLNTGEIEGHRVAPNFLLDGTEKKRSLNSQTDEVDFFSPDDELTDGRGAKSGSSLSLSLSLSDPISNNK